MTQVDKSWWAKAILIGAVVAAALLLAGALGSRFGIWNFQIGLLALLVATVLALIGLVVGIVAMFVSSKRGYVSDRTPLSMGIGVCLLILAVMGTQIVAGVGVPPIHNISTDTDDPPRFDAVVALRGENSNPLEFDAAKIAPLQEESYPWVKPLLLASDPDETLERVIEVLTQMGLDIVATNRDAGIVEATATTFWFGFKDDVVVRVRNSEAGSIVDVRSVSRVGVSDVGANARRIGVLLDGLRP